ncbi:hypothetical protein [Cellvibrio sp. PSBB023]|uniref:hypothetical protein n=1 Tax=Cellvibrio sp. PSBB023 TaxID=1945512 RepID=UPI00098FF999|nr:hypothetical protein [Cellvibrio sp. PSBB023]AQT61628.1 hypothetical protein B0D95_17070 [Cellvibrio sp. PSBB023]
MTNKELKFVASLKRSLKINVYVYAVVAITALCNSYFQFMPELNTVYSLALGIVFCFVSLSNYLGDTQLHKCSEIIDGLINKDPELIKRLNEIKEGKVKI